MTQTHDHLSPDSLSAFIDGELPLSDSQAVQQHVAQCHACAMRVISATQLKKATALDGRRFAPAPEVLARLAACIQSQSQKPQSQEPQFQDPKKKARIYLFPTVALGALAAALLLSVALFGWRQVRETNALSAELLDQHLATLSSGASPEVISTDRHTVKPWFQGKLPFSFNIPEVLPPDTALKGANLTYLDGQPAALLLFTIHKHEVSLFLTQRSAVTSSLSDIRSGFTIRNATTHDLRIVAVSDVNPADLDLLVSALVEAQSPR